MAGTMMPKPPSIHDEIRSIKSNLHLLTNERDVLEASMINLQIDTNESARLNHEARLTEMNSVIGHLQAQLDTKSDQVISEASEHSEDDEDLNSGNLIPKFAQLLPKRPDSTGTSPVPSKPSNLNVAVIRDLKSLGTTRTAVISDLNSNTLDSSNSVKSPVSTLKEKEEEPLSPPGNLNKPSQNYFPTDNLRVNCGGHKSPCCSTSPQQSSMDTSSTTSPSSHQSPPATTTEESPGEAPSGGAPVSEAQAQAPYDVVCSHNQQRQTRKSRTRRKKPLSHRHNLSDSNENLQVYQQQDKDDSQSSPDLTGPNHHRQLQLQPTCQLSPNLGYSSANKKKTANKKTLSSSRSSPFGKCTLEQPLVSATSTKTNTGRYSPEKPHRLSPSDNLIQFETLRDEVALIRQEHYAIRETLTRKDGELYRTKTALHSIASERDLLKKKVQELECLLKQSPKSLTFFPSSSASSPQPPTTLDSTSFSHPSSPCRKAERVKLSQRRRPINNNCQNTETRPTTLNLRKNSNNNRSSPTTTQNPNDQTILFTGRDLTVLGPNCNSRLMEHVMSPIHDDSAQSETEAALKNSMVHEKLQEYQIQTDRLNCRLDHLRSQNDVLALNLEDAKGHSDRLTGLLGKYESNNIGHQITLSLSDQLIDAYDVLVALLESELGLLLANCRAAGIGAFSATTSTSAPVSSTTSPTAPVARHSDFIIDVASLLHRANDNRMTAEIAARNLITRMLDSPGSENNNSSSMSASAPGPTRSNNNQAVVPWEDASSRSQTMSSASSTGTNSSGGHHHNQQQQLAGKGNEEQRVRDYIIQLKTEREAVRGTLMELENWSMEPLSPEQPHPPLCDSIEARKMDLETAVLMQELMAMREDRAELRAQLFLMAKERSSLEYRLGGYDAQLDAYRARVNHLKAELADHQQEPPHQHSGSSNNNNNQVDIPETLTRSSHERSCSALEEREAVLKKRIHDLAASLDKITYNANLREEQSVETVNELKRANSILVDNLETVKKKYQNRVKKMEDQILSIMEKHSMQMKLYKDRLSVLEMEMLDCRQAQ